MALAACGKRDEISGSVGLKNISKSIYYFEKSICLLTVTEPRTWRPSLYIFNDIITSHWSHKGSQAWGEDAMVMKPTNKAFPQLEVYVLSQPSWTLKVPLSYLYPSLIFTALSSSSLVPCLVLRNLEITWALWTLKPNWCLLFIAMSAWKSPCISAKNKYGFLFLICRLLNCKQINTE